MDIPIIDLKETGENIKALRKGKGMKVWDLQDILGFSSPNAIYKWQRGECLPTIDNMLVLTKVFGVPVESILVTK